jgi:hypothetical protein
MADESQEKITTQGFRRALEWIRARILPSSAATLPNKSIAEPKPSLLSGIDASDIPPRATATKADQP